MRKLATVGLSVATVLSLTGAGVLMPVAGADVLSDLQAQIELLTAQIAALTGGSTGGSCYAFTVDLSNGSKGTDVTALQDYLTGTGHFTFSGGSTGYFGPITTAAVAAWQTANGVTPAYGYFGPVSRVMYNSVCTPAGDADADADADADTGDLEGGAGSINDADWVSGLSSEEVGEDEADVDVAGIKIEADSGSDIELTAVRLDFTQGTANRDFDKYADDVSLWFEGEEVARVDADEFTDDNAYDKTISLSSDPVIKAGTRGELVVAVTGISNLDSADAAETWTVEFESVRFIDAQGASVTDNATGDINGVTRTFSFETFATASSIELKIAEKDNDAVNKAHMVNVHATQKVTDIVLLEFTLEAEGDSDLEFREFGADFVVTAADVDDMISGGTSPAAYLELDGDTYGTAEYHEAAAADRQIMWDDVDYTLSAGDTIDGRILVDLLAVSGALTLGDTILAQITETETDNTVIFDVRDDAGDQIVDADMTGTATGEANQAYDVTYTVTSDGWDTPSKTPSDTAGIDEEVLFTMDFDVTAVDGIVYVDDACTEDTTPAALTAANTGFNFFATNEADSAVSCSFTTAATAGTGNYIVNEGETETFSVSLNAVADVASDYVQVTFEGLSWSIANGAGDRMYEGTLDNLYKSTSVYINNR